VDNELEAEIAELKIEEKEKKAKFYAYNSNVANLVFIYSRVRIICRILYYLIVSFFIYCLFYLPSTLIICIKITIYISLPGGCQRVGS